MKSSKGNAIMNLCGFQAIILQNFMFNGDQPYIKIITGIVFIVTLCMMYFCYYKIMNE